MEKTATEIRLQEEIKRQMYDILSPILTNNYNYTLPSALKYNPKKNTGSLNVALNDMISDAAKSASLKNAQNAMADVFDNVASAEFKSFDYQTIEIPLYVGKQHDSEVMTLIRQIYENHGNTSDTGSLYRVQDSLEDYMKSHASDIRQVFSFILTLPDEEHANILSSWPRPMMTALLPPSNTVTIKVHAYVQSVYFIGYETDDNLYSPLRLVLNIQCQTGCARHVRNVLAPLLLKNGTFFVVGAADLMGEHGVDNFEVSKLGFIDELRSDDVQTLLG